MKIKRPALKELVRPSYVNRESLFSLTYKIRVDPVFWFVYTAAWLFVFD